jgi:hypothetical protein
MKIVESASLSFLSAEEPGISSGPDQPQKNSQTSIQALDKKLEANKRAVSPAAVAHGRLDHDLIVLVKTTRLCRRELSPTNPRPRVPRVPLNQLPWPVSSSKKNTATRRNVARSSRAPELGGLPFRLRAVCRGSRRGGACLCEDYILNAGEGSLNGR